MISLGEVVRIILCFFQVSSLISISSIYIILVYHLIKNPSPGHKQSNRLTKTVTKVTTEIICDIICWVPSNVIFLSAPYLMENPYDLVLWTIALVLPSNALLHPLIFSFATLRGLLFTK